MSISDSTDLTLGNLTLTGDLTVVAALIDGQGTLEVAGITTVTANTTITLDNLSNDFGTVVVLGGTDVIVNESTAVTLGDVQVSGTLTVESGIADDTGGIDLAGDLDVGSALNLTAGTDGITQSAGTLDVTGLTTLISEGVITLGGANNFIGVVFAEADGSVVLNDINNLNIDLVSSDGDVTLSALTITDAQADGGTVVTPPPVGSPAATPDTITRGTDNILVTGTLTVTADSFGTSADPIEIDALTGSGASSTVSLAFDIQGGGLFVDFAGDIDFDQLSVLGATQVELAAFNITVNADFNTGTFTDIEFLARNIIFGGTGTITAESLQLDARAVGQDVIGSIAAPILLNMANGTDYRVPDNELNGFGFINASNFTGTDFNTIFNASGQRIFLIANFTDLIASVQGSFITAQIFTIDSSQFRADLNIFGVEGAGVLLPYDQCEDEESADCAKQ